MRKAHLEWCVRRGLRPGTIEAKNYSLARFERCIAPVHALDATAADVALWYATVGGMAQNRHCELSHVRQFYLWLVREGHRTDNPTAKLLAPKLRRRLPRPIPDDDLKRALDSAKEPVRTWLLFQALAGLRSCEVAQLHADDILRESGVLYVAEGKGGHDRTVPLHPTLAELDLPRSGFLWPESPTHIASRTVVDGINGHLRKSGTSSTGHTLRHFFCTKYYEASGYDLRSTQEVMGHLSPTHTALYTAWCKEKSQATIAAITI